MSATNNNLAMPESFRVLSVGDNDCGSNDYAFQCISDDDGEIGTIVFRNGNTVDMTGIRIPLGFEFLANVESIEIISGTFIMYEN